MRITVGDLMTRGVVTVSPSATFKEMVGLIKGNRISALPVVDLRGRLVGIVSEADLLLKEELSELAVHHLLESRTRRQERAKAVADHAADVMTSPAISVTAEVGVADAARLMHKRGIKRLPVVGPLGELVGIISRSDLLRVFLRPDDEIASEIREELIIRTLWMDPTDLDIAVSGGVVTLRGQVDRLSDAQLLSSLASSVNGVVSVVNELRHRFDDEYPFQEGALARLRARAGAS